MIKHVFWDLDGTLIDSMPGLFWGFEKMFQHVGRETLPESTLRKALGPPLRFSAREHFGFPEDQLDEVIKVFRDNYNGEGLRMSEVYAGVAECGETVKKLGGRNYIATLKPQPQADDIVKIHAELANMISGQWGAAEDLGRDNKKGVLLAAMRDLNAKPEECVMIGDRSSDITSANELGLTSISVLYGYGQEDEMRGCGADLVAKDTSELNEILEKLLKE